MPGREYPGKNKHSHISHKTLVSLKTYNQLCNRWKTINTNIWLTCETLFGVVVCIHGTRTRTYTSDTLGILVHTLVSWSRTWTCLTIVYLYVWKHNTMQSYYWSRTRTCLTIVYLYVWKHNTSYYWSRTRTCLIIVYLYVWKHNAKLLFSFFVFF